MLQVTSYLTKKFAELHSPNKFKVYLSHGGKPWVSDFNHPHYLAGRRALKTGQTSSLGADRRWRIMGVWLCQLCLCAGWAVPPPTLRAGLLIWTWGCGPVDLWRIPGLAALKLSVFYSILPQFLVLSQT